MLALVDLSDREYLSRLISQPTDDCILYELHPQALLPVVNPNGKPELATRMVYESRIGRIKPNRIIKHKDGCGNARCVNPNHLIQGFSRVWHNDDEWDSFSTPTYVSPLTEAIKPKITVAGPRRNSWTSLTPELAIEIGLDLIEAFSYPSLAAKYNVGVGTIAAINHGKRFAEVTGASKEQPLSKRIQGQNLKSVA